MTIALRPTLLFLFATMLFVRGQDYTAHPVSVYVTAEKTSQRLSQISSLDFVPSPAMKENDECVYVDPSHQFQTVLGIGGALTDASAETFAKLSPEAQEKVLKAYFDPREGIGYTLARTNINSCDFSSENYCYVSDNDLDLKTFSIAHDLKYRIPFIKRVLETAGSNFTIFASPWSPPAWMKSNNNMLHGGTLLPEYYPTWANYCVKFIQAYEKEGIPIWGMTVQNEPLSSQKFESCIFSPEQERDYVRDALGPALAAAGLGSRKILIWDHNRNRMYEWAKVILDDQKAAPYVWGIAFHWYSGNHFENVRRVQEDYPNMNLMLTEACLDKYAPGHADDWKMGETYGRSMINDFNNGVVGWTDWNVLLDQQGGPNHVQNYCSAPIHADTEKSQLTFLNSYYYIGHFSKFIRPGAQRISCSSSTDNLLTTAFRNKDGKIAVVVMNPTDHDQPFKLWLQSNVAPTSSPAHSIMTLVLE